MHLCIRTMRIETHRDPLQLPCLPLRYLLNVFNPASKSLETLRQHLLTFFCF
jgi:hypothetical protein